MSKSTGVDKVKCHIECARNLLKKSWESDEADSDILDCIDHIIDATEELGRINERLVEACKSARSALLQVNDRYTDYSKEIDQIDRSIG